jgi:hypothetical protein
MMMERKALNMEGKTKFLENQYYKCWIDDGIVFSEYKVEILDLEAAVGCVALRMQLVGDQSYPTLIDGRKVKDIYKDARDYFSSDAGSEGISASALITASVVGRFIGSFFLKINRPSVPIKIFNNVEEAVAWLKQFRK